MTATQRSLITPTANPLLARALRDKLAKRSAEVGSLGELEPLALRLGLLQNSLKPRLNDPQLIIVASDHGLAVDGIVIAPGHSTADEVHRILTGRMPVAVLAPIQGMGLMVVDAGVADRVAPHDHLLVRKIAHGTRNTRVSNAMTVEQAHAAMRAGMEIGQALTGNVVACAGMGVGSGISAALVLARLADAPVRELLVSGAKMSNAELAHLLALAHGAQTKHSDVSDPVEVLAAFGGFEIAVLAGVMLASAQKRHLIMVDGMAACAALMVASRIAPSITDYCVFCRSQQHLGLTHAMGLFEASAVLEVGMNSVDGSGAALSWPLVRSAAALLTEVAEGDDAGPTVPGSSFMSLGDNDGSPAPTSDDDLLRALGGERPVAPRVPNLMPRMPHRVAVRENAHVDAHEDAPDFGAAPDTTHSRL